MAYPFRQEPGQTYAAIYEPQVLRYEAARLRLLEFAEHLPDSKRKIHLLDTKLAFLRACAAISDAAGAVCLPRCKSSPGCVITAMVAN